MFPEFFFGIIENIDGSVRLTDESVEYIRMIYKISMN